MRRSATAVIGKHSVKSLQFATTSNLLTTQFPLSSGNFTLFNLNSGRFRPQPPYPSGPAMEMLKLYERMEAVFGERRSESRSENSIYDSPTALNLSSRVLSCPLCAGPLVPPLLQCPNGHIACRPCRGKILLACPICRCSPSEYVRVIALEKVLEAAVVPCPHAALGCKEKRPFLSRVDRHADFCSYAPRSCLFKGCRFRAPEVDLLTHFSLGHNILTYSFSSATGDVLTVTMDATVPVLMLEDCEHEDISFLLINRSAPSGRAISIVCRLPAGSLGFVYELVVKSTKASDGMAFQMTNSPVERWSNAPSKVFLFVPEVLYASTGMLYLALTIWQI